MAVGAIAFLADTKADFILYLYEVIFLLIMNSGSDLPIIVAIGDLSLKGDCCFR